MYKQPQVSIVVPIHNMKDGDKFLWRLVNSLTEQTFKDWELIITREGKMAENTNAGIKKARGKLVKILYLDDYLTDEISLESMVNMFEMGGDTEWALFGTHNNRTPKWTDDIATGNNKLGSPSALMFRNHFNDNLLFDENMSWLLDCDYYKRMFEKYKYPSTIVGNFITLGEGDHQMTHILTDEEKLAEHKYMKQKYA